MSDNPNNSAGWHPAEDPNGWRKLADATPKKTANEATEQPTLPEHVKLRPAQVGGWHLPAMSDTTARPAIKGPRPEDIQIEQPKIEPERLNLGNASLDPLPMRPEDELFGALERASTLEPVALRPEDLLPEQPAAPRPEDLIPGQPAEKEKAPLRPEDLILEEYQKALAEIDEEEDEALSVTELVALQSLSEGGASGATEVDPSLDPSTLTAAERAALGIKLEETTEAFDYAKHLAELESNTDPSVPAFDYASQLAQLGDDTGFTPLGTDFMSATQAGMATPVMPSIDPEQEALAQKFIVAEQNIRQLRNQFQGG